MEVGVYEGMPFDDYAAIDAMNNTRLGWLVDESPAYYKHRLDHFDAYENMAMKFGKAAHCAVLEPQLFDADYVVEPDIHSFVKEKNPGKGEPYANPRGSKPYKLAVAELEEKGLIVLTKDDYELALGVRRALRDHPPTCALLDQAKGTETTLVWLRDGITCKARLDFWGKPWIADLKTTSNFGRFSPWEITRWHLYRQLAWYKEGAEACGLTVDACYLPVVASDVPEVALFALDLGAMQAGKLEVDKAWTLFRKCLKDRQWPGRYPNEVIEGSLTDAKFDELFAEGTL